MPAIEINGGMIPPIAYTSYLPQSRYYAEVAQCGVHLHCFAAYIAHRGINMLSGIGPFRRGIWTGEDELDFTDIHEDMGQVLPPAADGSRSSTECFMNQYETRIFRIE